jgi:hypothetical protein
MSQTLHFGVFETDGLFPVDSLDLTETPFVLEFDLARLFRFELFLVSLLVRLTSLTLSSRGRFAEDFPLLAPVGSMLRSKSSCWACCI